MVVIRRLLCGFLLLCPSFVGAATYTSGMAEGRWTLSASVFECRLNHDIAAFGAASFVRRAGEAETFRLRQERPLLTAGEAVVQVALPMWHVEAEPQMLKQVQLVDGLEVLRLDDASAQQLQGTLEIGRRLIVAQAQPWPGPVRVLLEPQGFLEPYQSYKQCVTRLLPANFGQVERTAIYFPADGEMPARGELRKLDTLVRYAKADSRAKAIFIDGHTDSEGVRPDNLDVSKQRAELIAAYLVERGIAETMLTTRWHGERYPVASNQTAQGRAQNRRVTLRLELRSQ